MGSLLGAGQGAPPHARGSCPGDSGAQAVADDRGGDRGGVGDAALDDSAILNRVGLGKRSRLEPPEPPNRYERSAPGEPVHVDVKKLARFHRPGHRMLGRGPGRYDERAVGYDYVHVCVDDYSRLAYVEVLPNERATTAIAFLRWAIKWFAGHGVRV